MKIEKIDYEFTVCRVKDYTLVNLDDEFCFIGKTDEEKSLEYFRKYLLCWPEMA